MLLIQASRCRQWQEEGQHRRALQPGRSMPRTCHRHTGGRFALPSSSAEACGEGHMSAAPNFMNQLPTQPRDTGARPAALYCMKTAEYMADVPARKSTARCLYIQRCSMLARFSAETGACAFSCHVLPSSALFVALRSSRLAQIIFSPTPPAATPQEHRGQRIPCLMEDAGRR